MTNEDKSHAVNHNTVNSLYSHAILNWNQKYFYGSLSPFIYYIRALRKTNRNQQGGDGSLTLTKGSSCQAHGIKKLVTTHDLIVTLQLRHYYDCDNTWIVTTLGLHSHHIQWLKNDCEGTVTCAIRRSDSPVVSDKACSCMPSFLWFELPTGDDNFAYLGKFCYKNGQQIR